MRHKNANIKYLVKKYKWFIIMMMFLVPVAIVGIEAAVPGSLLDLTPDTFQPVQLNGAAAYSLVVKDGTNPTTVLGTAGPGTGSAYFVPSSTAYPRVDVFYSDPFLSDVNGNPLDMATAANHQPTLRYVKDGQALFLHEYYFTVHCGARTLTNLKPRVSTQTILNPLEGITVGNNAFTTAVGKPTDAPMPAGCLAGIVDTGRSPWRWTWGSGTAAITCGLEYIDYTIGSHVGNSAFDLAHAKTVIATTNGNKKVIAQPTLNIQALSNYLTYNYEIQSKLSNGTVITLVMDTASAEVGFIDARRTDNNNIKGLLTSPSSSPALARTNLSPTSDASASSANPIQRDVNQDLGVDAEGGIEYLLPLPQEELTKSAEPHNINYRLPAAPPQIDFNAFAGGLPQSFTPTFEFTLQPVTTLDTARFRVTWELFEFDGRLFTGYSIPHTGTTTLDVPVGITITNVYAMASCTFRVAVMTENELQIVTGTGKPIDPSQYTDFELNSVLNDPTSNVLGVGASTQGNPGLGAWWDNLMNDLLGGWNSFWGNAGSVIGVVIAGAAGVFVIYIVIRMRKNQAARALASPVM